MGDFTLRKFSWEPKRHIAWGSFMQIGDSGSIGEEQ